MKRVYTKSQIELFLVTFTVVLRELQVIDIFYWQKSITYLVSLFTLILTVVVYW